MQRSSIVIDSEQRQTLEAMVRSPTSAQRDVLRAHIVLLAAESIQPHRSRYWKHSNDPELEPKMLAVVGLYLDPPENAVVLSVDEKTSIQALDRTQLRSPEQENPHLGCQARAITSGLYTHSRQLAQSDRALLRHSHS